VEKWKGVVRTIVQARTNNTFNYQVPQNALNTGIVFVRESGTDNPMIPKESSLLGFFRHMTPFVGQFSNRGAQVVYLTAICYGEHFDYERPHLFVTDWTIVGQIIYSAEDKQRELPEDSHLSGSSTSPLPLICITG
jgi:hypothetical protein